MEGRMNVFFFLLRNIVYNRVSDNERDSESAADMEAQHFMLIFSPPSRPLQELFHEIIITGKCFAIFRHDPTSTPDIPSEYETEHYHGLVRASGSDFNYERAWVRVRDWFKSNGGWFKSTKCFSIRHACAYMQMPGKEMVMNYLNGQTLTIFSEVTKEMIDQQVERKKAKVYDAKYEKDSINRIREYIFQSGYFTESEMLQHLHNNKDFEALYKMRSFNLSFEKARNLAAQRVIDEPLAGLLKLCGNRVWSEEKYYTMEESFNLVKRIMEKNEISMEQFVQDVTDLLDRKRPKINCLWMHGCTNAGKSYVARSIAKLCMLYHEIPAGSSRFMFMDCVSKRLIVMNEPYLDETSIEQCKQVMEGNGCFTPVKNKADQWLKPTPVIITSNTLLWQFNSQAKGPLLSRCFPGYRNMCACDFLKDSTKDLHPLWLKVAVETYQIPGFVEHEEVEDQEEDEWLAAPEGTDCGPTYVGKRKRAEEHEEEGTKKQNTDEQTVGETSNK